MQPRRNQQGFTLVELLIVMVIIGILATALVGNFIINRRKAERARAQNDIKEMDTALQTYYMDSGVFPSTQQGLQALLAKPSNSPVPNNWQGPYLLNRSTIPVDPWDHEYVYKFPGDKHPDSYDLYSLGPNGEAGGTGNDAPIWLGD
jgi:general secretion pathway protein G